MSQEVNHFLKAHKPVVDNQLQNLAQQVSHYRKLLFQLSDCGKNIAATLVKLGKIESEASLPTKEKTPWAAKLMRVGEVLGEIENVRDTLQTKMTEQTVKPLLERVESERNESQLQELENQRQVLASEEQILENLQKENSNNESIVQQNNKISEIRKRATENMDTLRNQEFVFLFGIFWRFAGLSVAFERRCGNEFRQLPEVGGERLPSLEDFWNELREGRGNEETDWRRLLEKTTRTRSPSTNNEPNLKAPDPFEKPNPFSKPTLLPKPKSPSGSNSASFLNLPQSPDDHAIYVPEDRQASRRHSTFMSPSQLLSSVTNIMKKKDDDKSTKPSKEVIPDLNSQDFSQRINQLLNRPEEATLKSGPLKKLILPKKNEWKKFWYVLTKHQFIAFTSNDPNAQNVPAHSIDVATIVSVSPLTGKKEKLHFSISTAGEVFVFNASSETDHSQWLIALQRLISSQQHESVHDPFSKFNDPNYRGTMTRQSNKHLSKSISGTPSQVFPQGSENEMMSSHGGLKPPEPVKATMPVETKSEPSTESPDSKSAPQADSTPTVDPKTVELKPSRIVMSPTVQRSVTVPSLPPPTQQIGILSDLTLNETLAKNPPIEETLLRGVESLTMMFGEQDQENQEEEEEEEEEFGEEIVLETFPTETNRTRGFSAPSQVNPSIPPDQRPNPSGGVFTKLQTYRHSVRSLRKNFEPEDKQKKESQMLQGLKSLDSMLQQNQ